MLDFNAVFFEKLYSKMAWAFGATEGRSEGVPDPASVWWSWAPCMLVTANPGVFVSSGLDPRTSVDDAYALASMLDAAPSFDWVHRPASLAFSAAYRTLLDDAEYAYEELHPAQRQKLSGAERRYYDLSERCAYGMQNYVAALDGFNGSEASFRNGSGPQPSSRERMQVRAAYDRWIANGKVAIETDAAVISAYAPMTPEFQHVLRTRFDEGRRTNSRGDTFHDVHVDPPCRKWLHDDDWHDFSFGHKDLDNQTNAGALGVAGGVQAGFGLFRVSSSGDFSRDATFRKIAETPLSVSCQLKRVRIERPWLHPLAFSNRRWRWKTGAPLDGQHFSTGGDTRSQERPQGLLPLLSTSIILCRNLKITGTLDAGLVDELNTRIKEDAAVGFGPFSISGPVSLGTPDAREVGTIGAGGIEVKGVQIVAQACRLLPKSPDPQSGLDWHS